MADAMGTEDPAKAEADALEAQTRRIVRGNILVDQEGALNGRVPQLFTSKETGPCQAIEAYKQANKEQLAQRKLKLEAYLMTTPKAGSGMVAMKECAALSIDAGPKDIDSEVIGMDGAKPMLITKRKFNFIPGVDVGLAAGYPSPGVASYLSPLDENMYVLLFRLADVLKLGIVLSNVIAFFETSVGAKFLKESTVVVRLFKGDLLFVPSGYYPILFPRCGDSDHTKDQIALTVMVQTIFSKALWKGEDDAAMTAIQQDNGNYCKKRSSNECFKSRLEALEKFWEKM